jgi:hypothetical protein
MAAIVDLADYKGKLLGGEQLVPFTKVGSGGSGRLTSTMSLLPINNGVAPTTAVALSSTSTGALPISVPANRRLLGGRFTQSRRGAIILVDRLSHQGGLSGTSTAAQTTNLPTAALTRYTGGDGVMIGLQIYTQIGATSTTVSASYTNQAGTPGRTTPLAAFGNSGYREALRVIQLPLAAGDTGVRAVASVTVTATTGTAGAFGVVLFKPLAMFVADTDGGQDIFSMIDGGMAGLLPVITSGAYLEMFHYCVASTVNITGTLAVTEE